LESHRNTNLILQEYLYQLRQQIKKKVTQELTQSLVQEFDKRLETLQLSQQPTFIVQHDLHLVLKINTKEIYVVTNPLRDDVGSTIQHELYTDRDSSPRLMTLGRCFEGAIVLPIVPFPSHMVKLLVEKVMVMLQFLCQYQRLLL